MGGEFEVGTSSTRPEEHTLLSSFMTNEETGEQIHFNAFKTCLLLVIL